MKRFVLIAMCILISSCNFGCATWDAMSENEKQTAMWVGGFLGTAAIISAADGNDTTIITECQRTGNHGCE